MSRYLIKACVGVLLFAPFDVSAGGLPLLGKIRFQRYYNCGAEGYGVGFRTCCPPSLLDSCDWLVDLGPILGIPVLILVLILGHTAWVNVKSGIASRKTAAAYEAKHGNVHPCAFCGQAKLATHLIFHSVFRRTDIRLRDYDIDRCGFSISTCGSCLLNHRLRYFLRRVLIVACAVGGLALPPVIGLMLMGDSLRWILIRAVVITGVGVISVACVFMAICRRDEFFYPWRRLARRHPAVAELLESGYQLDDDWPRLVREGLDTDSRQRTLERPYFKYQTQTEHETYRWMGLLQTFALDGRVEPKAADALWFMQDREKRRGVPCTAKDLSLQRATEGIVALVFIAVVYWIIKLLK